MTVEHLCTPPTLSQLNSSKPEGQFKAARHWSPPLLTSQRSHSGHTALLSHVDGLCCRHAVVNELARAGGQVL